jgi:hypothetical protein
LKSEVVNMASVSQGTVVRPLGISGRGGLVDRYFYFAMSLLIAAIIVAGFSRTIDHALIHATPPRPLLLWIHGAAFAAWVAFYIFQSALVRTHNVKWHRFFGWFGAGLAALMVLLGFTVAIIMTRFDLRVLHQTGIESFLSVMFLDMLAFGTLVSLAIYWRKKPELHRRLLFIATCGLLDAGFGRFDVIFNNGLFFPCLDAVILLGLARDLLVNRRIHAVYRYALPPLFLAQAVATYLWRSSPAWWLHLTRSILG